MFRIPGPASYMTPLDFFLLIDCTGTDPSLYKMKGFVTGEKFYPTIASLRSAFNAGELGMEYDQDLDADWALVNYKPELGARDLESKLAPATLEIGGKRYKVDEKNQYVEYMGWSFYVAFTRTLGVMLYDIKFKGERILYELSMQEATAQYGGNQPKAANTVYHDTYYSLGAEMGTLVEGYDCPFGSTFWNLTYHSGNGSVINTNSLCIFEADMNFPLSRHRTGASNDYGFSSLGTVKGAQLIVRAIATVGNYGECTVHIIQMRRLLTATPASRLHVRLWISHGWFSRSQCSRFRISSKLVLLSNARQMGSTHTTSNSGFTPRSHHHI
jgi:primary-amine oxidase